MVDDHPMTADARAPVARPPFLVGLTGGIASGKSAAAAAFGALGVTVIDADRIAREVVAPGEPLLARLAAEFGGAILLKDGSLDRPALRERVFSDPAARERLNALTHPAIRARMFEQAAAAAGPYVILEVPLLVEGGLDRRVDRVLVVDCPEEVQLAHLQARDALSPAQAEAMLQAQARRADRLAAADDVIANTGSLGDLRHAVDLLHPRYLELAAAR